MLQISGRTAGVLPIWIRIVGAILGAGMFVLMLTLGAVLAVFVLGTLLTLGLLAWIRGHGRRGAAKHRPSVMPSDPFEGGSGRVFEAEDAIIRAKSQRP